MEPAIISKWQDSAFQVDVIDELKLLRRRKQNLHSWVKVDQAIRPLPPKTLSILVGLAWKTDIFVQLQITRLETAGRFRLF